MTTTTLQYKLVPEQYIGLVFATNTVGWSSSNWQIVLPRTDRTVYIAGITIQTNIVSTDDTTRELLMEIGYGKPSDNISPRIQIPYSSRPDTSVGYYYTQNIFLPEPVEVPLNSTVCIRSFSSLASTTIQSGAKLWIMTGPERPAQKYEMPPVENFKNVFAPDGLSVTERGF